MAPIGERIRHARRMAGLSLRNLADEVEVSAQAISKYERGMDVPSSGVLLQLAKALDVKVEFFLRPVTLKLSAPAFRKRTALPGKQEQAIRAKVQDWLERYVETESLISGESPRRFSLPKGFPCPVDAMGAVEQAAVALRRAWDLGLDPIENLTSVLEDRGIKIGLVEGHDAFDALTLKANGCPVVVVRDDLPGDRQRLSVAHEVGHLALEPAEGVNDEKAAFRFAAAFLVPEEVAHYELSPPRRWFDPMELHLLKHKYGLSMQAWVYRAKDLGIISESAAAQFFRVFRQNGWHRQEPGDQLPPERPSRMERLILRLLTEDVISERRATELLGKPLKQFRKEASREHQGLPVGIRHGHECLD